MKTQAWLWAVCLAGACTLAGCGDDTSDKKTEGGGGETVAECGNGTVEAGEACDDGNTKDGDGCSSKCQKEEAPCTGDNCGGGSGGGGGGEQQTSKCGDGELNDGEACDDGNTEDGDGCSSKCTVESGWDCVRSGCSTICGDGIKVGAEECDDGNNIYDDGCSSKCTIEEGWSCPTPGSACVSNLVEVCGNGIITAKEYCDDGNTEDGDGCSSKCTIEDGWICDENGCRTECGDGTIAGLEECDDGDTFDGNGCSSKCTIEEGWVCDNSIGLSLCAQASCGDGVVQEKDGEVCDIGDMTTSDAQPSYGWSDEDGKPYCKMCQYTGYCGDGIVQPNEECDVGVVVDGKPTLLDPETGKPVGGVGGYGKDTCNPDCTATPRCGDEHVDTEFGEVCDTGTNNGAYGGCMPGCTKLAPYCGDGELAKGEICDEGVVVDGKKVGGTGAYGHCKANCLSWSDQGYCGDKIINGNEKCDDGRDEATGESLNIGGYNGCMSDCSAIEYYCGDKLVGNGLEGDAFKSFDEECDNGALNEDNVYGGCSSKCKRNAYCGDGVTSSGEECDPTDPAYEIGTYGKKACSESCQKMPYCGDGKLDKANGEECDDGLGNNDGLYGGCSTSCKLNDYCGDGKLSPKEDCDPTASGWTAGSYGEKACTANCVRAPYCGDGVKNGGEECDYGATGNIGGYGNCTSTCKLDVRCGDGLLQSNYEMCDDAGANTVNTYGTCNKYACIWNAVCGDGIVNGSEKCDDGGFNADNTPVYYKTVAGRKIPLGGPSTSTYGSCKPDCSGYYQTCGDGIIQSDYEMCDNGAANTASTYGTCNSTSCQWNAVCGDGIVNGSEKCDDGGFDAKNEPLYYKTVSGKKVPQGGDGVTYDTCKADCSGKVAWCGDGKVQTAYEFCDDKLSPGMCKGCEPVDGYMCTNSDPKCPKAYCADKGKDCALISDLYGDGILQEDFEDCDDGNKNDNDGCTKGKVDKGYDCPDYRVGKRCVASACGDGIQAYGEECDDGNAKDGDGCSARCKLEDGFACTTKENGKTTCDTKKGYCGDGVVQTGEECDDGNYVDKRKVGGKGCSTECKIESGYECRATGGECKMLACGTGAKADAGFVSFKQCDLGSKNGVDGSGCTTECRLTDGWYFDAKGTLTKGYCGDGVVGANEQCDDGNTDAGDACNPICEIEPVYECFNNECKPICGDGLVLTEAGEECDDGNLISGDGCDSQCKPENGYTCTLTKASIESTLELPITYRDVIRYNIGSKTDTDGYVNKTLYDSLPEACKSKSAAGASYRYSNPGNTGWPVYPLEVGRPNPDFRSHCPTATCEGAVKNKLGKDGTPDLADASNMTMAKVSGLTTGSGLQCPWLYTCPEVFKWWFSDVEGLNRRIDSTLVLKRVGSTGNKYSYSSSTFFPLTDNPKGYGNDSSGKVTYNNTSRYVDGEFTSQFSTLFQYQGNEVLTFTGDDDVWVFFNGYLGVDVGGIHGSWSKTITLTEAVGAKFHMYKGGIYSLDMFHAERCTGGSNFNLTLDGFVRFAKSSCKANAQNCGDGYLNSDEECDCTDFNNLGTCKFSSAIASKNPTACTKACKAEYCGDGVKNGSEECDRGGLNSNTGKCTESCKLPVCGDGFIQAGETCDNGSKNVKPGTYSSTEKGLCTTECRWAPYCGDGIQNGSEECDRGAGNNDSAYGVGACTKSCKNAPYCGDGIINGLAGRENCDNGAKNSDSAYGEGQCTASCKTAPYCGDRKVTGSEECDRGSANSSTAYGAAGCLDTCKAAPYCGDGKTDTKFSEQCDNGAKNASDAYGVNSCTLVCKNGPYCGDGIINGTEACDLGTSGNTGAYGGCKADCTKAAYCGDGIKNGSEACDKGADNTGAYGGCKANCTLADYCGDGIKNGSEQCDLGTAGNTGAYGGCKSDCTKAAYCGDGIVNGTEECDDPAGNTGTYGGCRSNCTKAPYCGDGGVNGAEQCDLGVDASGVSRNVGGYDGCKADCTKDTYCGDGIVNGTEECDDPAGNTGTYGGCKANCTKAAYCGDGIVNGTKDHPEACDDPAGNTGAYGGCNADCSLAAYCGDGVKNGTEECDGSDGTSEGGKNYTCTDLCTRNEIVL